MGKPLQQDSEGNIMNDEVTKENQKGYANYEAELKKRQDTREAKDKSGTGMRMLEAGLNLLRPVDKKAKGGSVKSASARADGCAIRGKTRA